MDIGPPKDTWFIWNVEPVTRDNVEEIKKRGVQFTPETNVCAFRCPSPAFPNPAEIRCKLKDLDQKIAELHNREPSLSF